MNRRGHGEGTIYQLRDGRWWAAISLGWRKNENGQPIWKRKTITKQTRNEVAEQLKKELRDQQRGMNIDPNRQTIGQFLDRWLEDAVKPSVRPKTYRSYEQMLRNHIIKAIPEHQRKEKELDVVPGLGPIPVAKLTRQAVQRYLNEKLEAGNSPSLVRYLRAVLRIGLNQAVKDDLIPRNPAALAKPPRVERREVIPFNPEQDGRFLKAAQDHRLEALFTAGLAVGLRSGECSALRWKEDVDLAAGAITVHHTLQRQKGIGLALMPPKSEKSRRTIELPNVCVTALKKHQERQQAERQWAGTRWHDTG